MNLENRCEACRRRTVPPMPSLLAGLTPTRLSLEQLPCAAAPSGGAAINPKPEQCPSLELMTATAAAPTLLLSVSVRSHIGRRTFRCARTRSAEQLSCVAHACKPRSVWRCPLSVGTGEGLGKGLQRLPFLGGV